MEFKRIGMIIGVLVIIVGFITISRRSPVTTSAKVYTIGILQTASHPALDAVRDGFMAAVSKKAAGKIDFVVRNGQGNISSIHTIAQQFHAKSDIDAIFAIATPAAQAIIAVEKTKPIIMAAVTVTPELAPSFAARNICGVNDLINVRKEVEAVKSLLPATMKTIGILYSTSEVNAVAMADIMVAELERAGYTSVLCGISSEADIEAAVASAMRKVDALLCPTDNVIANAIALIVDITAKTGKPLIVSDNLLVQHGALMARGVDYYQNGQLAGEIAVQVVAKRKKPKNIGIIKADNKEIYVNKATLERLGLVVPDKIKKDVVLV